MNKIKLYYVLFFLSLTLCCCGVIRYQNIYLPKGFIGNVAIIYKNGAPIPKDTINISIPTSGIFYSSSTFVPGNYINHYLQENDDNSYDTLTELVAGRTLDINLNQIIFPRVLTFQEYQKTPEYTVYTFYVGRQTANDLATDHFHFERELEKLLLK